MDRLRIEGRAVAVLVTGLGLALDVSPAAILVTAIFTGLGYAHVDPRSSIDAEPE
jgi:hypothetical protein